MGLSLSFSVNLFVFVTLFQMGGNDSRPVAFNNSKKALGKAKLLIFNGFRRVPDGSISFQNRTIYDFKCLQIKPISNYAQRSANWSDKSWEEFYKDLK